ncbi:hypothetical protein GCM10011529_24960 [Polymorphobacter glacialis]|uniref:Deacetylase PdaC domain-containing protein n=1 Tax=Sandarakinorhabdus glacialis TaxID=1614636 RepID=A0A917E9R6_9SPHN|nr:DUF4163 domain-containing protein [Polymorphobacter glacialis]GGE17460.1 hypothetical protein GCM10011529_24960 [Polymorphobacter glacialis]
MRGVLAAALLLAGSSALSARVPAPVPASDLMIRQASPGIEWRWRMAPETATQQALLRSMRTEALGEAAKARRAAAKDLASAQAAGFPFRPYETINDWTLAADTPRLLSLALETWSHTGGAHGNTGFAVRIWDKTARRSIGIDALFTDWPRARKLIEPQYCRMLAEEQRRRRGEPTGGAFDACPSLAEQPILPWAGLGQVASQYRVLLGPYVAGPYSEGSYLVTVPWPDGIETLVKPEYRADLFGPAR